MAPDSRPSARALLALVAITTSLGAPRTAADAAAAAAESDLRPAFLQLWVNEVAGVTALSLLAPDGDVWVTPEELSRSGLYGFEGARREIEGRTFVSLRSLGPELRFTVDDRALAVRIIAGRDLLRHSILELRPSARPPNVEVPRVASAFLNWSARSATDDAHSAFAEAGVAGGNALLSGSASATREGGVVRNLTALTVDDPDALVRLVVGDDLVQRTALGGGPQFGGVTLKSELSLDPYLVRAPLPQASAFAATPSTVEVYLNGSLVRTERIAPGTYDLTHLPVAAGASDLQIVVRDAYGRSEVLQVEHYAAQGLLVPGLHEWAWHVGVERDQYGAESFSYDTPLLAGRHRAGVTGWLTLGASIEATPDLAQASGNIGIALPFGEIEASAAGSVDQGRSGGAALLAWRYFVHRMAFGADGSVLSSDYANLALGADDGRPRWRGSGYVTFPVGPKTSATLRWVGSREDAGESHRVEARSTIRLGRFAWLTVVGGVARTPWRDAETTALVSLGVATPDGSTMDAGARRVAGVSAGTAGAQRPLTRGPGVGYRLRGDTEGEGTLSALVQAQPSFGRLELAYDRLGRSEVASATVSSAFAIVADRIFVTRPVEQSFALVRVPGVAGVRTYLENVEVGRTNRRGDLLVPGLLPYYASRLSIADVDIPVTYKIGSKQRVVAVPARAGGVVQFDVEQLRAVAGTIRLSGSHGPRIPAYGTLEVDGPRGPVRSPIAEDGAFWLEDVTPGPHAARVYWQGDVCEFALSIPASEEGLVNVGDLGCEERERL